MKSIFSKKKWGILLAVLLLISTSIAAGTTFAKYISEISVGSFDLRIEPMEQPYAVFNSDGSFEFYYGIYPEVGTELKEGKTVVKVYHNNIATTNYTDSNETKAPEWYKDTYDEGKYVMENVESVRVDESFKSVQPVSLACWFRGFSKATSFDLQHLDTSEATNMARMFAGCSKVATLNVTNFDTSKVTDINHMFSACNTLTAIDLSSFNTGNVEDMSYMFSFELKKSKLKSVTLSPTFTTAKVTTMTHMFNNCRNLSSLDLSSFDTGKVKTIAYMFAGCGNLGQIIVSDKWSLSNTELGVFNGCHALVGGNGTAWQERQTYFSTNTNSNNESAEEAISKGTYARIDGQNGLRGYFTPSSDTVVTYANVTVNVEAPLANGGFATIGQHHYFTNDDCNTIILTSNGTNYAGNVTITCEGATQTVAVTEGKLTIPADYVTEGAIITIEAASTFALIPDMGNLEWSFADDAQTALIPGQDNVLLLLGWTLPQSLTVNIDGMEYTVPDDGGSGISYDPINGILTLPAALITEETQSVIIAANSPTVITLNYDDIDDSHMTWVPQETEGADGNPVAGQSYSIRFEAHEGYVLAESFAVTVDESTYTVLTDGSSNEEGKPVFDPVSGMLTIPAALLTENTLSVKIAAQAVKMEAEAVICELSEGCTLEAGHEGDCVLPEPETVPCTNTEGCTLEAGHEGDCVLPEPETAPCTEGCTLEAGHEGDCALPEPETVPCTEGCTLETGHEGDCVLPEPETAPCTEGCTLEAGHEGDCVLAEPETVPCTEGCTLEAGHEGDCALPEPETAPCTEGCTLEAGHEGDCVLAEPETIPCTNTEGCTLEAGHEGDCVLPEPEIQPVILDDNSTDSEQPTENPLEKNIEDAALPKEPEEEIPSETPTEGDPPTEE